MSNIEAIVHSAKVQKLAESSEWGKKPRKEDAKAKKRLRSKIKFYLKQNNGND